MGEDLCHRDLPRHLIDRRLEQLAVLLLGVRGERLKSTPPLAGPPESSQEDGSGTLVMIVSCALFCSVISMASASAAAPWGEPSMATRTFRNMVRTSYRRRCQSDVTGR